MTMSMHELTFSSSSTEKRKLTDLDIEASTEVSQKDEGNS